MPENTASEIEYRGYSLIAIEQSPGWRAHRRAVAVAADLVKFINGKLLIVHVSEDKLSGSQMRLINRLRVTEGDALRGDQWRDVVRSHNDSPGSRRRKRSKRSAEPDIRPQVIMEIAKSKYADVIVVGRHGYSPLEGLLLGSVSQNLTSLAPCPVIVIP